MAELRERADHDLHQGPLVGQRQPSTAITTEYASADPVFQAKTAVCHSLGVHADQRIALTRVIRLYRRSILITVW